MTKGIEKKYAAFVYPFSITEIDELSSRQQLVYLLNGGLHASGWEDRSARFLVTTHKHKYVYAKCTWKGCSAHLRYTLTKEGRVKLTKADNMHTHCLDGSKNLKFKAVTEYLNRFSGVPLPSLRSVVCSEFNISDKQFYYLIGKMRGAPLSCDQLVSQLEKDGYQVYCSQQERLFQQPPQILLVTNEQMQQNFKQWGQVVMFDFTFNLIKNIDSSGMKWKIGFFLALNSARHIVPLAIVTALHTTKQSYVQIFSTFFKSMKSTPAILITDQEKSILSAVEELASKSLYEGYHLLDSYHILHNVRKKLSQKQNIVIFSRLVHAKNKSEFQSLVQNARTRLPAREHPILDRFLSRSHLYCFSCLKPRFIGFSVSTSPSECLHSVLKKMQPQEKQYSIALKNCLKYANKLNKKCLSVVYEKFPIESIFHMNDLRIVRTLLCKSVLAKLTEEISNSMRLQVLEGQQMSIIIREHSYLFKVERVENRSSDDHDKARYKWKCDCGYFQKMGLPCRHQLRAIFSHKQSILPYLSQRWIIEASEQKPVVSVRGRQRNSSRTFRS